MARLAQQTPDVPARAPERAEPDTSDLRTFVTISRQHEDDVRQRQVIVRIDGGPTATLMFGQTVTFEVKPGLHVLRANNTLFWKKVSFAVEPGEHLEFVLINRAGRLTIGFLALMGVAPLYLTIERRSLM
ncbi:MAG TPA: hypothetical protein VG736_13050 [Vicinamibacterales bacterium]|nr:hypothetical protein [Vicinamibacterales bacterium]